MPQIRSVKSGPATAQDGASRNSALEHPQCLAEAEAPAPPAYAQAGVIVDERLMVIEFLGDTGRYLQLPVGKARLNLRLMLPLGLQHPVLEAVQCVREGNGTSRREHLALAVANELRRVNVEVMRLDTHPSRKPVVRVLFEEAKPRPRESIAAGREEKQPGDGPTERDLKDLRVTRLKDELRGTRAMLESIIEEQESGTVRLKSAYYQLESANAELEAANEELGAANEELETLNEQLEATIRERDAAERERKLLEAEVVQAQRLESLRVMAGGVAHDFNNLLTSIIGNSSVLIDELPRDSELWAAAEQIDKAGQHASGLVKQMLAFCGKSAFVTEPLDLSTLVRESVDLLRASISKTVELRCELAEDLPTIEADTTQVRQVLINLVVNASEAIGPAAGVIRVSTRRFDVPAEGAYRTSFNETLWPGAYVCLEVADTGGGMSDEAKAKIFEPFFSTKFAGRGLGMAAVLGIVRGHHGSIQVHGQQAEGTQIEVLFPASDDAPQRSEEPLAAADCCGGGLVLVVDDEESVRNVVKAILKRTGLRVITAAGGHEALDILRRDRVNGGKVDVVLLDLAMPQMDGKEVLAGLRSFFPDLPVIVSSGYMAEHETAVRLAACSPTSFLAKPYRPAELLEEIREALAIQAAGRRNQSRAPEAGGR